MDDESWRHLLLLEAKGDVTRVITKLAFRAVVNWTLDNWDVTFWGRYNWTYGLQNVPDRVLHYNCVGGNSSLHGVKIDKERGEGQRDIKVKITDVLSEALMIYAVLSDKDDDLISLVWFRNRDAAVLFKLSTGDE